ncbi:DNase I-like protein [Dioscorea alata]|uniref:DNase I-like protein n=1 Tax=Dioscorea alata TaxID=55571 RepID=A0ACB7UEE5_DIOAL|nr:DNase I-like protein [Dioscorea alata]
MKVLSWNVRDLGRPFKRHLVKYSLTYSRANIVCLQETNLQDIHTFLWRSIGSQFLDSFEFLPAVGTTGEIIMAWDKNQVSGSLIHIGSFSITTEFTNHFDNSIWLCSSAYGPIDRSLKGDFLE